MGMNSNDYRSTLGGVTPSPAWRERTLAAMKQAQGKKRPSRKPLAIAATAAALAVAVTGGVRRSRHRPHTGAGGHAYPYH